MTLQRHTSCIDPPNRGAVDDEAFRRALGCFASGVAVITTAGPEGPAGLVVSSFSSVSLDPPLVGFYVARTSRSWPEMERSGRFLVNIAASQHEQACRNVVARVGDRFEGLDWEPRSAGPPRLVGALAAIECTIHEVHDAGDHRNVLGLVTGLTVGAEAGLPLLHYRGGYRRIAPEPAVEPDDAEQRRSPALDTAPSKR